MPQEITSITVRPDQPHIFCSTSRDFTARIYDLTLRPQQEPANVHWPPYKDPNKAGPAFGLHMTDNEGPPHGIGRCIAVTGAQRSGGHRAAVLHAVGEKRCEPDFATDLLFARHGTQTCLCWRLAESVLSWTSSLGCANGADAVDRPLR